MRKPSFRFNTISLKINMQMYVHFLIGIVLLFGLFSHAVFANSTSRATEATVTGICPTCNQNQSQYSANTLKPLPIKKIQKQKKPQPKKNPPQEKVYYSQNKSQKNEEPKPNLDALDSPACKNIMSRDGTVGYIGKKIQTVITYDLFHPENNPTPYSIAYLSPGSLSKKLCPNFNKMSPAERLNAWTWYWTALAIPESTCNPNVEHDDKYIDKKGIVHKQKNFKLGWGLWAAELHEKFRDERGPMCMGNIKDIDVQVTCAIHTMYAQTLNQGQDVLNKDVNNYQYWGPNVLAEKKLIPNMKVYKPCWDGHLNGGR